MFYNLFLKKNRGGASPLSGFIQKCLTSGGGGCIEKNSFTNLAWRGVYGQFYKTHRDIENPDEPFLQEPEESRKL